VTGQGLRLASIGVVLGLCASLLLGRFLAARLYGVAAGDPITLGSVAILLLFVTAVACAAPAVRAARLDPVRALRD